MNINHHEQSGPWKHELGDYIDQLRKLDKLRNRSAELRNKGLEALGKWLMKQPGADKADTDPTREADAVLSQANVAVTLYQFSHHFPRDFNSELRNKIKNTIDELDKLPSSDLENHSLLVENAAHTLHVLAKSPNAAFSEKALWCFCYILREIYTADAPDWAIGGLRAANGGSVSAYVTSLCLHALLEFAEAQENTAKFLRNIRSFLEQLNLIVTMPGLENWKGIEIERLRRSYYLTLGWHSKYLVLGFESPNSETDLEDYVLNKILPNLIKAIKKIHNSFNEIFKKYNSKYHEETDTRAGTDETDKRKTFKQKQLERSELGHKIACDALCEGGKNAEETIEALEKNTEENKGFKKALDELEGINFSKAIKDLKSNDIPVKKKETIKTNLAVIIKSLKMVEDKFKTTAYRTRESRYPVENYLKGVLDHQLAIAESGSSTWEPYELACAAECLGAMDKQRWSEDKRLERAVQKLSKVISDRGFFPVTQPYYPSFNVPQSTIAYVFSELSRLLPKTSPVKIETEIIERLIYFFEDTFVKGLPEFLKKSQNTKEEEKLEEGWCSEYDPHPCRHPCRARPEYTVRAVQALASLNNLLDEQINSIILDHFTIKRPEDIKLDLEDLFYPDYGLTHIKELTPDDEDKLKKSLKKRIGNNKKNKAQFKSLDENKTWSKVIERTESVALTLQDARAHVLKTHPKNNSKKSIHSLVLHGPPGTGKTTLVEALAKSCSVPLVEVTPSDIVMGGMEAVERSARIVFEALSFLTRAVILFDEFDPVLWRRDPQAGTPDNVFSFLTPGMLPKLKNLHDKTKRRSVAYVLSTNLIGSLDDAAVRKGRFDEKIGIFPPDHLSRIGRLNNQYFSFKFAAEEKVTTAFPSYEDLKERIDKIVQETKGGPMDLLGKPRWFTKPKLNDVLEKNKTSISKEELGETPFGHLIFENGLEEQLEREAEIGGVVGEGKTAIKEWMQWYWISEINK